MNRLPPALNLVVIRSTDIERARQFYLAMGLGYLPEREAPGAD